MSSSRRCVNAVAHQRGSATLVVSVGLLLAITIMVFFIARTNLMEQRIAANDYRGEQAFEAAEAGLEYAIGRIDDETLLRVTDTDTDGAIEFACVDGAAPAEGPCNTPALGSGATATGVLTAVTAGNPNVIEIVSTGYSDDRAASRQVTMQVSWVPMIANRPRHPLVSRRHVALNSNVQIHNPLSGSAKRGIWSGEDTDVSGSSSTNTAVVNRDDNNLRNASENQFFETFFLMTKARAKSRATVITKATNGGTNYSAALAAPPSRVVWIDGQADSVQISGGTVGSTAAPVLLVIENFSGIELTGGAVINGLIYLAGDWIYSTNDATINGAVLVEGDVALAGSLGIVYEISNGVTAPGVVDYLPTIGQFAKVPGSWRDF